MSKQLDLFDLSAIAPPPPPAVYDPVWDKDDTFDSQLTPFDNSSPEYPSSQESFSEERWNPADFGEVPHKADGSQLTIFYDDSNEPPDPDDYQNLTEYQQAWTEWQLRVREHDTQKSAPEHIHWLEEYWVKRGTKKHYYYRYCWMLARKIKRVHIGSVSSAIAKNRKVEVESAIADGESPSEIQKLIRFWKT